MHRAIELQARICGVVLPMPIFADELRNDICNLLASSAEDELLKGGSKRIWQLVKMSTSNVPDGTELVINLGDKNQKRNQKRSKDFPHVERFDGAWFDFALTAFVDFKSGIFLQAYSFEIRLPRWPDQPEDEVPPSFVRFDLNKPGHDNEGNGERCHVHVGSDLYSAPAPLMRPLEILDLFVHGLRPSNIVMP
jgi:hypothetical protein